MRIRFFSVSLSLFMAVHSLFAQQNDKLWTIEATDTTAYMGASVANGIIGILPSKEPFSIEHVMLNHVFEMIDSEDVNRSLRGINPFSLSMNIDNRKITGDNITKWKQVVDMKKAIHTTTFTVPRKAEVKYSVCALRNLPFSGLIQVEIKALDDISIECMNEMEIPSDYIEFKHVYKPLTVGIAQKRDFHILQVEAQSLRYSQRIVASSEFMYDNRQLNIKNEDEKRNILSGTIKEGETIRFALVGSVCSTRDFFDPKRESERQVIYAAHEGVNELISAHNSMWEELWQGDIIIEGDKDAQLLARFALFHLYSSCRENSRLSIPPMGLSSTYFFGHIFWDAELWVFPPLLFMNQGIAESMVNYRVDRLKSAELKAMTYGYKGAMYPWESDNTGEESTHVYALPGQFEHHVTACVSIGVWNYYKMTRNKDWLKNEGYPLLKKTADFWVSRAVKNSDGTYSIKNVVGADEYAEGVTDNAFTNGAVKKALEYAVSASKICNEPTSQEWIDMQHNLRFFNKDGITLEYDGYDGYGIKQADVNLLGYPLGVITDREQIKRDLEYYESKIDVHGPAMSFSVFSILYSRLGNVEKATEMFHRCYEPNLRPPFGVLAETGYTQNPYFMTGAGGILQAIINGFGGLELTDGGIVQHKTQLPKTWKKLTIKGVGPERKTFVVESKKK